MKNRVKEIENTVNEIINILGKHGINIDKNNLVIVSSIYYAIVAGYALLNHKRKES